MKLSEQHRQYKRIQKLYPDRIGIIVNKVKGSKAPNLDKNKFVTPPDITMAHFVQVIRKRLKMNQEEALFVFVNKSIPCMSHTISQIHSEFKSESGLLLMEYTLENTFG